MDEEKVLKAQQAIDKMLNREPFYDVMLEIRDDMREIKERIQLIEDRVINMSCEVEELHYKINKKDISHE